MKDIDKTFTVDVRGRLPDELLELLRKYPRDHGRMMPVCMGWQRDGASDTIFFASSRC